MKKITKPVYHCDHCKKHGLSISAMVTHERKCMSNPENHRACIDCIFLDEIGIPYTIEFQTDVDDYRYDDRVARGFKCLKLNKSIYHVKAEIKDLPKKWSKTFEGQEPMPKECEHQFKNIDYWTEFGSIW